MKYLPPMPQSPTNILSVITIENTDGMISLVTFSREIGFFARFIFYKNVGVSSVFLFFTELAIKREITNDQYFDKRIPLVGLSGKILLTNYMPYTDRMNLSVKLFNGVVNIVKKIMKKEEKRKILP